MFEAFRCTRPVAGEAAARSASQSQPVAAAAEQQHTTKRRRLQQPSPGGRAGAAATAGGLALEKMGDQPLRLVIVGHNPSEHAWASGHFYSNPSNWLWRILRETGIAPPGKIAGAEDDGKMPEVAGVGFTDVGGGQPGTDSSQFTSQHFEAWRPAFFARMAAQARRASNAIGCTCGGCGAPCFVAFSGKRQFQELFLRGGKSGGRAQSRQAAAPTATPAAAKARAAGMMPAASIAAAAAEGGGKEGAGAGSTVAVAAGDPPDGVVAAAPPEQQRVATLQAQRPSRIDTGRQWVLPEGWPLPLVNEVWVMTSTSGAAPMTQDQRFAPWQALAERLGQEPWPRQCLARCRGGAGSI